MYFQVKVRVDVARLAEFASRLQASSLDRRAIRGETYCLADDPAVGWSVWEAQDRTALEAVLTGWRPYYSEVEVRPVITPGEALRRLAAS